MASGGTLAKLPLDVLELIFRYACTSDGGYTGCSISRVSKAVHLAGQSTRFHAVALIVARTRTALFLTLYQRQLEATIGRRSKLSHLHISLPTARLAQDNDDSSVENSEENSDDIDDEYEETVSPECMRFLRTLFQLTTDDLRTLVITSGFAHQGPLFDRPFPNLRELTLVHHADPLVFLSADCTASPLFPTLTHLHVVADTTFPFPTWSTHAPRVTHLRISSFPRTGGRTSSGGVVSFAAALAAALGARAPWVHPALAVGPPVERTWPSLRHVVLQPPPRPGPQTCGTARMAHGQLLFAVARIEGWASKEEGLVVRVLRAIDRTEQQWRDRVLKGWLEGRSAVEVAEDDEPDVESDDE